MVQRCLLVTGGKGGIGKSTITAGLARSLASSGRKIGILDADLSGPNQSVLFQIDPLHIVDKQIVPAHIEGVKIVTLGGIAQPETALVWSDPVIRGTLRKLVNEVKWEHLDLLIVDVPPGSGNIHMVLHELFPEATVLFVTTGSPLAIADCLRQISFYRRLKVPMLGILENFSEYPCSCCGKKQPMYDPCLVPDMAADVGLQLLDRLPWSQDIANGNEMTLLAEICIQWLEGTRDCK